MIDLLTMAGTLGTSLLGSFVGNGTDVLTRSTIDMLRDKFEQPRNHDIAIGMVGALNRSLDRFFRETSKHADPVTRRYLKVIRRRSEDHLDDFLESTNGERRDLIEVLDRNLVAAIAFDDQGEAQRSTIATESETAVLEWIVKLSLELDEDVRTGADLPWIRSAFLGQVERIERWRDLYRLYLGDLIKKHESRFREILDTSLIAAVYQHLKDLPDVVDALRDPCFNTIMTEVGQHDRCRIEVIGRRNPGLAIGEPDDSDIQVVYRDYGYRLVFDVASEGSACLLAQRETESCWYIARIGTQDADVATSRIARVNVGPQRFPLTEDPFVEKEGAGSEKLRFALLVSPRLEAIHELLLDGGKRLDNARMRQLVSFIRAQQNACELLVISFLLRTEFGQ